MDALRVFNGNEDHLNELLRVPFDYCIPSVNVEVHFVDCIDVNGKPNRVLVIHVEPSMRVHANQADDAFYRVVLTKRAKLFRQNEIYWIKWFKNNG